MAAGAFAALLLVTAVLPATPVARAAGTEVLTLLTSSGEHRFTVEIAESDEEKGRGLMFRSSLADDAGMLFIYPRAQQVSMWMRNTYISLDMVFIADGGTVHRIERRTEPFSERLIDSQGPVRAVLELSAGTADRIGLKPGDKVASPRLQP